MTEYIIDWDTSLVIDTFSKNNLREEIVRCRDCKHATGGGTCCWYFAYDELDGYNEWISQPADVEPDGFCKWGERREE